eukprot:9797959-Karenia_brevis.AAC.1
MSAKACDVEAMQQLINAYVHREWGWNSVGPPGVGGLARVLDHANNSAPGVDGAPYMCWKAAGPKALDTLYKT